MPSTRSPMPVRTGNGTDNLGVPDMSGVWTFVADESSPNTPMVLSLYAYQAGRREAWTRHFPAVITHGPVVNGVEIGKMWQWTVTRSKPQYYQLNLNLQSPARARLSRSWTLSNEYLTCTRPVRPGHQSGRHAQPGGTSRHLIKT